MAADHSNDGATPTEIEVQESAKRWRYWGPIIFWALMALGALWLTVLTRSVFFPTPMGHFIQAELLTPRVLPTGASVSSGQGTVKMKALVQSAHDPSCLISTQYFIQSEDGIITKAPGLRRNTVGDVKAAIYEAGVPYGVKAGYATYWVNDIYICGLQIQRIESPHLQFMIEQGQANAVTAKP